MEWHEAQHDSCCVHCVSFHRPLSCSACYAHCPACGMPLSCSACVQGLHVHRFSIGTSFSAYNHGPVISCVMVDSCSDILHRAPRSSITWSTCFPQPLHVGFWHESHDVCIHMMAIVLALVLIPECGMERCGTLTTRRARKLARPFTNLPQQCNATLVTSRTNTKHVQPCYASCFLKSACANRAWHQR